MGEAERALLSRVAEIKDFLTEVWVDGDGNCMFRAVAIHTDAGEASYENLRALAVNEIKEHWGHYRDFDTKFLNWLRKMQKGRWGHPM